MNISNLNILRQFYSVVNKKKLTQEIYDMLLDRWGLTGVDLNQEAINIELKKSNLSCAQRKAIPDFLKLQEQLKKETETSQLSQSINSSNDDDSIINVGSF